MKKHLEPRNSNIHGKGLFATKKISLGTCLGYCKTKKSKTPGIHTLWLTDDKPVEVTCRFKYINHSATPNVVYYNDRSVYALRDIGPGDELTHFYGEEYEDEVRQIDTQ